MKRMKEESVAVGTAVLGSVEVNAVERRVFVQDSVVIVSRDVGASVTVIAACVP